MLINISNHPFRGWSDKQKEAALVEFQDVIDIEFPSVGPDMDLPGILQIACNYIKKILEISNGKKDPISVHIMGEMTFCFALVAMLQKQGIRCVASTTRRIVRQNGAAKTSEFDFVRFRDYPNLDEL